MLIFLGESAHCIRNWFEVSKFLYAYTCPFPKNIKHPKNFYVCSNSKIRKFEDGFSKFWKFEKRSSKFWNIRKIGRGQMNGANGPKDHLLTTVEILAANQKLRFQGVLKLTLHTTYHTMRKGTNLHNLTSKISDR